jgi:hypothetical protein
VADSASSDRPPLTADERERLTALRAARSLADLRAITDTASEHEAYLDAKAEWERLRKKELGDPVSTESGLPGQRITLEGKQVYVHGITHENTDAERTFLRRHVTEMRAAGEAVYCEQGIRPMYFPDMDGVCEIDDYRWAMHRCQGENLDSAVSEQIQREFDRGVGTDLQTVASQFRDVAFGLIESGSDIYGEGFAAALGDVASDFLLTHEELATGDEFEAFQKSRAATADPAKLPALQQYYRRVFLPQPVEREWLRGHDPELELFTHGRNERIAEYVLYHHESGPVHIITGAAHQPGVWYYLRACRDDEWSYTPFETVA